MMHMVGYFGSIANGSAFVQLDALTDSVAQIRDSAIVAPTGKFNLDRVIAGIFYSANLTRAQLQLPSLRKYGNYEFRPVANAFAAGGAMTPNADLYNVPLIVEPGEELPLYVIHSNAAAQDVYAALLLADEVPKPDYRERISVHATSSTTLTANAWTSCSLAFDTQLPKGSFALVGMRAKSAGGVAFRVQSQTTPFYPGGFCQQSDLALDYPHQRDGGWGVWCEFDYLTPPAIWMLSTSADTSEDFILDLVPL